MRDKDGSLARLAAAAGGKSLTVNIPGVGVVPARRATESPSDRPTLAPGMTLMGLDVSSKAAGLVVVRGEMPGMLPALMTLAVVRPSAARPAPGRIDAIVAGVRAHVMAWRPGRIVMEFSDGHTAGRLAKASGLSVLGAAQGAVREALRSAGCPVEAVGEGWTQGRSKRARARNIRWLYPEYAAWADAGKGRDAGLDACDALGLALWRLGMEGPQ